MTILEGQARVEVRCTRVATLKYVDDSNIQIITRVCRDTKL